MSEETSASWTALTAAARDTIEALQSKGVEPGYAETIVSTIMRRLSVSTVTLASLDDGQESVQARADEARAQYESIGLRYLMLDRIGSTEAGQKLFDKVAASADQSEPPEDYFALCSQILERFVLAVYVMTEPPLSQLKPECEHGVMEAFAEGTTRHRLKQLWTASTDLLKKLKVLERTDGRWLVDWPPPVGTLR